MNACPYDTSSQKADFCFCHFDLHEKYSNNVKSHGCTKELVAILSLKTIMCTFSRTIKLFIFNQLHCRTNIFLHKNGQFWLFVSIYFIWNYALVSYINLTLEKEHQCNVIAHVTFYWHVQNCGKINSRRRKLMAESSRCCRTAYWYLTVICTLFKLMTTKQETWKTYAYFTWVTRNKNLRDANGS